MEDVIKCKIRNRYEKELFRLKQHSKQIGSHSKAKVENGSVSTTRNRVGYTEIDKYYPCEKYSFASGRVVVPYYDSKVSKKYRKNKTFPRESLIDPDFREFLKQNAFDKDYMNIAYEQVFTRMPRPSIKTYIGFVNERLKLQTLTKYLEDGIIKMDLEYNRENKRYEKHYLKLLKHDSEFKEVLKETFDEYVNLNARYKPNKLRIVTLNVELECLNKQCALKRQFLQTLIGKMKYLEYSQKIVYRLSPYSWRLEYDNINPKTVSPDGYTYFPDNQEVTLELGWNLSKEIDNVLNTDFSTLPKPFIHSKNPNGLITQIAFMNETCGNFSFSGNHNFELFTYEQYDKFKTEVRKSKNFLLELEVETVRIESASNEIRKTLIRSIYNDFYNVECTKSVLNLTFNIERFFYEKFPQYECNEALYSTREMLHMLCENYFVTYECARQHFGNKMLTNLLKPSILRPTDYVIREKLKSFIKSYRALETTLIKSFVPALDKNSKRPKENIKVTLVNRAKREPKQKTLRVVTDEELLYLKCFTDWVETENPYKYLKIYMDDKQLLQI